MITRKKFDFIKENYGQYASWAVWAEQEEKPKSKMGDLSGTSGSKLFIRCKPQIME